jgi:hypothetical protein
MIMSLSYRTDPWMKKRRGLALGPTEATLSYIARDYKGEPLGERQSRKRQRQGTVTGRSPDQNTSPKDLVAHSATSES